MKAGKTELNPRDFYPNPLWFQRMEINCNQQCQLASCIASKSSQPKMRLNPMEASGNTNLYPPFLFETGTIF